MGKEEVQRAAQAMDDEAMRERVAVGDFADVADLDLDERERALLREAASRYPEVTGFSFFNFFTRLGIRGEATDDEHKDWVEIP